MDRVLIPDTREAISAYDSLFRYFILGLPVFDMEFSEVSWGCLQQSVFYLGSRVCLHRFTE